MRIHQSTKEYAETMDESLILSYSPHKIELIVNVTPRSISKANGKSCSSFLRLTKTK